MSIAAIIVTYNRKDLLFENLKMLLKQTIPLDSVIIVDNAGTDGTREAVLASELSKILNIDYVYLNSNTGGAGGFSYGVEYAYKKGFDWLLLMDDDGKPFDETCIEKLLEKGEYVKKNHCPQVMLNSVVTSDGMNLSFLPFTVSEFKEMAKSTDGLFRHVINPFNATLISKEAVAVVGYPRADFFMSCDEREYNCRNEKMGTFCASVLDSIYVHPNARDVVVHIFKKKYELFSNPNKEYYFMRNNIIIEGQRLKFAVSQYLKRLYIVFRYEDNKMKRARLITKATLDGVSGRMGKRVF